MSCKLASLNGNYAVRKVVYAKLPSSFVIWQIQAREVRAADQHVIGSHPTEQLATAGLCHRSILGRKLRATQDAGRRAPAHKRHRWKSSILRCRR
jgi:hypothetical protein